MATNPLQPKPQPIYVAVQTGGRFTQAWQDYLSAVDNMLRTATTVALVTPTNANAKAAGVPLGGLYTDQADPAKVYIRTV